MDETRSLDDLAWLRRLARTLVRDTATADDAVQDTLIAASGARHATRPWLARTLRNFIRQEHRSRTRRALREEATSSHRPSRSPAPDELLAELESHRLLADAVHALDDPYRETLLLRFVREWSPRRIAAHHDVPVKTVHTRIDRGLARLRAKLDRHAPRERWLSALVLMGEPRAPRFLPIAGVGVTLMSAPAQVAIAVAVAALIGLPFLLRDGGDGAPSDTTTADSVEADVARGPSLEGLERSNDERSLAAPAPSVAPVPAAAEVEVTEERWLDGVVVDVEGAPLRGVRVAFQARVDRRFVEPLEGAATTSDTDGRFRLTAPTESGRVDVLGDDWVALHRPFIDPRRAEREVAVVASPRRSYAGRVVDDEGDPVRDARVAVQLPDRFFHPLAVDERVLALRNPLAETTTDERGAFEFAAVGYIDGALLSASRDGFESAQAALPRVTTLGLELVLQKSDAETRSIHGRVLTPLGTPATSALVSAGGDSVAVQPDGSFTLPIEPWRDFASLRAIDDEHGAVVERLAEAELERALAGKAVELLLPGPSLSLRGRVVDERGEPVANARVWTPDTTWFGSAPVKGERSMTAVATTEALASGHPGPFPWTQDTRADARGEFELTGLANRAYDVFVSADDSLNAAGPMRLTPGAEAVRLVLPSEPKARVAGVVVDANGRPVDGVAVHVGRDLPWERPVRVHDLWEGSPLRPPSASCGSGDREVRTDAEGAFEFPALVLEGSWITVRGDEAWMPPRIALADADDPGRLRIVVGTRAEFQVTCRSDADAFRLETDSGEMQHLFVPVEDSTWSAATAAIVNGRSLRVITGSGPVTIVLLRGDEVLERREVELVRGAQVVEL